jgi:hypothetical protein
MVLYHLAIEFIARPFDPLTLPSPPKLWRGYLDRLYGKGYAFTQKYEQNRWVK